MVETVVEATTGAGTLVETETTGTVLAEMTLVKGEQGTVV